MAKFFIDRPIFAWVIAIIIMLAGVISLYTLPVAQYPQIAAPEVAIQCTYPGASAKTVEDTVTQIIEQQMKGIDNLSYMYSTSDSMGQSSVTLSFSQGTDPDIAQVQVQNKLQLATPMLPAIVQRTGVRVSKSVKNFLLVISFISKDNSMTSFDLNDFVVSNVQDPISRVPGVGDLTVFGSQYAMRIWCKPDKFEQYGLNISDVAAAIDAQNAQIPGGQIGSRPALPGQQINVTINAMSRLQTVKQFENILLRVNPDGSTLRLKEVAKVELSGENYTSSGRYNRSPSGGLAIKLATGANALETAANIKAEVEKLSAFFPPGMEAAYPYDTSPFVRISIDEVYKTLGEAVLLVFLVMYLFLQDFRATLIPTIAVPVVLLGTFGVLAAFGFTINTLTMFALVLAIGLLVDDAIVVVENVERVMHEEHLPPREATKKSMGQITGALVGMTLVLIAVFIPMAFFGGSVGVIYRQFSITIASAMSLSLLVAMVLTPALCSTILRSHGNKQKAQLGFFGWFNRKFDAATARYQGMVQSVVQSPLLWFLGYALTCALVVMLFMYLPSSFLPEEDQGILMAQVQLPPAASMERTLEVIKKVEDYFLIAEKEAVASTMAVAGFSFSGLGQNSGMFFIRLKDWKERTRADLKVPAIVGRAMMYFSTIQEGAVFAFPPPAVVELGQATGFVFELIDKAGLGHTALMQAKNNLLYKANEHKSLARVRANGLDDVEQYNLDIDLAKAGALSVNLAELNTSISAFWGSMYVNDFMDKGRTKKVYLQAEAPYRMQADDFNRYYIRNTLGDMVPFSAFMTGHYNYGSPRLERYNGQPSREIMGEAAPGKSSGQAMEIMEELAKDLPSGMGFAWTGLSYQERMSGAQAPALYALSLLVVFLCLAALYESWSIPFSVMLIVPFGVLGALGATFLRGMNNDVYFQVGLLTTVGLSAKNAILIVEFAKELAESGQGVVESVVHAVRMRLRPILMTSLAFTLGVLPLALSSGAGSGSQNSIGTAVVGGTIMATISCLFYTPIFFVTISMIFKPRPGQRDTLKKATV